MHRLKLLRIAIVTARHPLRAHNELTHKGNVETNEYQSRGDSGPEDIVHFAEHLRPPVMQTAKECHYSAPHHDIMKMRYHEIGVSQMNVGGQSPQEQAG